MYFQLLYVAREFNSILLENNPGSAIGLNAFN